MAMVLASKRKELGVEEFSLNLDEIYPSEEEQKQFDIRWKRFYESDKHNPLVFKKVGNNLKYLSESWIPTKVDKRPPLLLLFGNPAPHSVVSRMYFAYEGKGREHRQVTLNGLALGGCTNCLERKL